MLNPLSVPLESLLSLFPRLMFPPSNRSHFYINLITPTVIFGLYHLLLGPDRLSVSSPIPSRVFCFQSGLVTVVLDHLSASTLR